MSNPIRKIMAGSKVYRPRGEWFYLQQRPKDREAVINMANASKTITGDGKTTRFPFSLAAVSATGNIMVQVWEVSQDTKTVANNVEIAVQGNKLYLIFIAPPEDGQEFEVVIR